MEARKEVGARKLNSYSEQLGDYFAKETAVKLGILTNGIEWKFFTDLINDNVMDKEPFFVWDVLNDVARTPLGLLTLLQKNRVQSTTHQDICGAKAPSKPPSR